MVTPFRADGSVDEEKAVEIGRHLLANGSHGLVVAGTTGEAATMTDEEHLGLIELIARELGDEATVVGGTGSNDTRHAIHLTEKAVEAGVDAVLSVTPYYNKPNRRGVIAPLQGGRPRRRRHPGDPLQHPGPHGGQHAAGPARRAGADRRHRSRQAGQRRRAAADRRARRPRRQRRQSTLEVLGARRHGRHLRRLARRRAGDAPHVRRAGRAGGDRRLAARHLRGDVHHREPRPGEGRAADARPRRRSAAPAARRVRRARSARTCTTRSPSTGCWRGHTRVERHYCASSRSEASARSART